MKEITITVPDNCELKQDGNTYTIVEKEKKLTYEDIARSLFSKPSCYFGIHGIAVEPYLAESASDANNCTSRKQAEKLLAINKLINVAKYLNGDWQPNWSNTQLKYYIYINSDEMGVDSVMLINDGGIYFKSRELVEKAIEILGEETIKLALCTDY